MTGQSMVFATFLQHSFITVVTNFKSSLEVLPFGNLPNITFTLHLFIFTGRLGLPKIADGQTSSRGTGRWTIFRQRQSRLDS